MLAAQTILLAIKPQYLTETVRNTHVEPILSTKELTSHEPTKSLYTSSIYGLSFRSRVHRIWL
jgi:hypothetical protein